jgi:hypothetical protein
MHAFNGFFFYPEECAASYSHPHGISQSRSTTNFFQKPSNNERSTILNGTVHVQHNRNAEINSVSIQYLAFVVMCVIYVSWGLFTF